MEHPRLQSRACTTKVLYVCKAGFALVVKVFFNSLSLPWLLKQGKGLLFFQSIDE